MHLFVAAENSPSSSTHPTVFSKHWIILDNLDRQENTHLFSITMEEASNANGVKINKKKFQSLTLAEDPHQFHAKPKDLSINSVDIPLESLREGNKNAKSDYIFSRNPFSSFLLDKRIIELLENPITEGGMGLKSATNVQSVIIPALIKHHKNMLIKSQTGSGKTLSYLVPMMNDLISIQPAIQRSDGTRALIIAPTRELCVQISDCLSKLTQCCVWIVAGSISGGEKRRR